MHSEVYKLSTLSRLDRLTLCTQCIHVYIRHWQGNNTYGQLDCGGKVNRMDCRLQSMYLLHVEQYWSKDVILLYHSFCQVFTSYIVVEAIYMYFQVIITHVLWCPFFGYLWRFMTAYLASYHNHNFFSVFSGSPTLVPADCGIENCYVHVHVATVQMALRHFHNDQWKGCQSFKYGKSTTNTVSELTAIKKIIFGSNFYLFTQRTEGYSPQTEERMVDREV